MKKRLALLLAAALTVTAAFTGAATEDVTGEWYANLYGMPVTLILDENGEVPNFEKAMLSDAIATCMGAICGTSTVSSYVESSSGVAEGGRTGLTSVVTGIMFLLAMFLSPIAVLIPGSVTAAALIYVGALMMGGVADLNWQDISVSVPAFFTIVFMPFTYNISYGIAFGLISYILIHLLLGKVKEIKPFGWVIAALFAVMFLVSH